MSFALAGRFLSTGPPGKPLLFFKIQFYKGDSFFCQNSIVLQKPSNLEDPRILMGNFFVSLRPYYLILLSGLCKAMHSAARERPLKLQLEDTHCVTSDISLHLSRSQIPLTKWEKDLTLAAGCGFNGTLKMKLLCKLFTVLLLNYLPILFVP